MANENDNQNGKKPYRLAIRVLTKELPSELSGLIKEIMCVRPDIKLSCHYIGHIVTEPDVPFPIAWYTSTNDESVRVSEYGTKAVYGLLEDIKMRKI